MTIQIYLGDCLNEMQKIPDGSVDMICADLPYGATACRWDAVIPFEPLWAEYKRVATPSAAIVLTASQPFTSALVMSNLEMFKYELIWNKCRGNAPGVAKYRPLPGHESVLVFGRGKTTYNPQMTQGKPYSNSTGRRVVNEHQFGLAKTKTQSDGKRYPTSVVDVSFSPPRTVHPTQKPVELMEWLIRTYTNEGETVLDNTMGSGTCGVAAVNLGRRFIGIELDPQYFAVAQSRIYEAQATPQHTFTLTMTSEAAE